MGALMVAVSEVAWRRKGQGPPGAAEGEGPGRRTRRQQPGWALTIGAFMRWW